MIEMIFEKDPDNPVYKDELTGILKRIEKRIHNVVEKYKVIITYNTEKYPNELACAIISTTVKLPSHPNTKNIK